MNKGRESCLGINLMRRGTSIDSHKKEWNTIAKKIENENKYKDNYNYNNANKDKDKKKEIFAQE